MTTENAIYDGSALSVIYSGLYSMKDQEFRPDHFIYHILLILFTAGTVGFFAKTRYKNYKKNKKIRHDRLGT